MGKEKKTPARGKGMTKTDLLKKVDSLEYSVRTLKSRLKEFNKERAYNKRLFNRLILLFSGKITIFNAKKVVNTAKNILNNE